MFSFEKTQFQLLEHVSHLNCSGDILGFSKFTKDPAASCREPSPLRYSINFIFAR